MAAAPPEDLGGLEVGKHFLNKTSKVQSLQQALNGFEYIKIKGF